MRYWQSYRFVFYSPNWLTNLLLGGVCLLIPWIGQIVMIGYLFEVIDVLLRRRQLERGRASSYPADEFSERVLDALPVNDDAALRPYPDFAFHRFSEYLTRGIWPFLVRLIVNMVVGVLAGFLLIVGMLFAGFAAAATQSPLLFLMIYGLFWIFFSLALMAAAILTTPLYLRSGLRGDLVSAFSMAFYRDFLKRVGMEVVLTQLFLAATGAVLSIGGVLMCYIGLFPVWVLTMYAQHHLDYQLYELYLERGGMPVPRKEPQLADSERYADEETPSVHVRRPRTEERSTDVMREDEDW
jgi:hypothetical protein